MVKIKIFDTEATISNREWSCNDPGLLELLNAVRPLFGPSGADPDPDYALAQHAIEQLGGEIVESDDLEEDELEDGQQTIY